MKDRITKILGVGIMLFFSYLAGELYPNTAGIAISATIIWAGVILAQNGYSYQTFERLDYWVRFLGAGAYLAGLTLVAKGDLRNGILVALLGVALFFAGLELFERILERIQEFIEG